MNKPIIEVQNVSFSYGQDSVLSDISFSLEPGDFLAIVGPNGSGKTTLIKLLLGLYSVNSGMVKLCGKPIQSFSCFGDIGYVPQKATHFEKHFPATVKEVVGMGLLSGKSFPKVLTVEDEALIERILKKVGMNMFQNQRIGKLSGGQQQRVLIAKALISKPKVLFLDEPATGIDKQAQHTFYSLLKELNDEGITIVLISHDIGRVTKYVTKVASLSQTLRFYGSHAEFCIWDKDHHHDSDTHLLCPDL